jgi:hypothetical protein
MRLFESSPVAHDPHKIFKEAYSRATAWALKLNSNNFVWVYPQVKFLNNKKTSSERRG